METDEFGEYPNHINPYTVFARDMQYFGMDDVEPAKLERLDFSDLSLASVKMLDTALNYLEMFAEHPRIRLIAKHFVTVLNAGYEKVRVGRNNKRLPASFKEFTEPQTRKDYSYIPYFSWKGDMEMHDRENDEWSTITQEEHEFIMPYKFAVHAAASPVSALAGVAGAVSYAMDYLLLGELDLFSLTDTELRSHATAAEVIKSGRKYPVSQRGKALLERFPAGIETLPNYYWYKVPPVINLRALTVPHRIFSVGRLPGDSEGFSSS